MKYTAFGKILFCAITFVLLEIFLYLGSKFMNPLLLVFTFIPFITILLTAGLLLMIKNKWLVILVLTAAFILGMFLFFNITFYVWVILYILISLSTTVVVDILTKHRHQP